METLSAEILEMIFTYCEIGDRLLLEAVNTRFQDCMQYSDVKIIDVPYFEKLTRRSIVGKDAVDQSFLSSRGNGADNPYVENDQFLLKLFRCLVPKVGNRLEGVRFATTVRMEENAGKKTTIEWKVLSALHELNPDISTIDFGSRRVRVEALKLLPYFKNLRRLTIYSLTDQFDSIMRQLRLTSLRFGGWSAPVRTADGSCLRHLVCFSPVPRRAAKWNQNLSQLFPNLEVLHFRDQQEKFKKPLIHDSELEFQDVDQRVAYINQFPQLRRSNLFGRTELNLASMVSCNASVLPFIQHLNIQLPPSYSGGFVHPGAQFHEAAALEVLSSWPRFFDRFRSIKSVRIACGSRKRSDLKFGVPDLFHLAQLENLRTLVLDELDFGNLIDADEKFLEQVQANKPGNSSGLLCGRLRKLSIKTKLYRLDSSKSVPSLKIFDAFVRFVLANSSRLKTLKLNYLTENGWKSLLSYAARLGNWCPLETLRIRCDGLCTAFPLSSLVDVQWPRLKELNVWCCHDTLWLVAPQHTEWQKSAVIDKIGEMLPHLRYLRWPEPCPTPAFFDALLTKFRRLREVTLLLAGGNHVADFFDCIPAHPNLEVVRFIPGEPVRPEDSYQETKYVSDDTKFVAVVEKRHLIARENGLRDTELKVKKEKRSDLF